MRITIIGYSGAGKSTFAKLLGQFYQIEPTYLDTIYWLPNWVERNTNETKEMISEVMKKEDWIIDGNYKRFSPERHELANQIFFFNFNRFQCLWNAIKRRIKYNKKARPDMTEGNFEKFDFEFLMWIMKNGRTKEIQQNYENLIQKYKDKTIVFTNHRQVNNYLRGLKNSHW